MREARDQISSYLLGELDAAETAAFERRLDADPDLREDVERLRPVVGSLEALPAEIWEAPQPPSLAMPEGAEEPAQERGNGRSRTGRRLRLPTITLRPAPGAALAALLLAVGVAGGLLIGGNGSSQGPGTGATDLVLRRTGDGPPGARGDVFVGEGKQRATVDVEGLKPNGSHAFYELWLLDDDGRMIALGSFRIGADGRAKVDLPIPVAPSRYRYFDISLQEDNGNPTHSGISVLRGPTSS